MIIGGVDWWRDNNIDVTVVPDINRNIFYALETLMSDDSNAIAKSAVIRLSYLPLVPENYLLPHFSQLFVKGHDLYSITEDSSIFSRLSLLLYQVYLKEVMDLIFKSISVAVSSTKSLKLTTFQPYLFATSC